MCGNAHTILALPQSILRDTAGFTFWRWYLYSLGLICQLRFFFGNDNIPGRDDNYKPGGYR